MLKRKDNSAQNIESIIGEGVVIKGNITSQGSIRVDGYVEGKLETKADLIVGEKGQIKGELVVENLTLSGKIEGTVITRQRCLINESGVIQGDVSCNILSIEEGGTLQGASKMNRFKSEHAGADNNKGNNALGKIRNKIVDTGE